MAENLVCEIELREKEGREPQLRGVILTEGRVARKRQEMFVRDSVDWPASGISVRTVHLGREESKGHVTRAANGELQLIARATPALRQAVESGKRFMSVEFLPRRENRTAGGVREILSALVTGATVTDRPEYLQTSAEVRETDEGAWAEGLWL